MQSKYDCMIVCSSHHVHIVDFQISAKQQALLFLQSCCMDHTLVCSNERQNLSRDLSSGSSSLSDTTSCQFSAGPVI